MNPVVGYTCKYTPIELLAAFGAQPVLLNRQVSNFEYAEKLTHPNLCCHAKAFLQHGSELESLIFVNCCDSIRRVYDVLAAQHLHKFLFLFDLPHTDEICEKEHIKGELIRLSQALSASFFTQFDKAKFLEECANASQPIIHEPFIVVLGARVSEELLASIRAASPYHVVDATCSGNRSLELLPPDVSTMSFDVLMESYAAALLHFIPCMRMENIEPRRSLWENEHLQGIIYNTVKFCDYYNFDYSRVKKETKIPLLKIESDFTPQSEGQLSTRLCAFFENLPDNRHLQQGRHSSTSSSSQQSNVEQTNAFQTRDHQRSKESAQAMQHFDGTMFFVGIDSGSTTTKVVVCNERQATVASSITHTGAQTQKSAQRAIEEICRQLGIERADFAAIVATGYGRNQIAFATHIKTEITCHAKGAHFLNPEMRTIIDIGGQDSKVIRIDAEGNVVNFVMNDKCAAGTGRFLEAMARTLELDLDEMVRIGLVWKHDLSISSMCTVFAESEVISLIAENHPVPDIIHGLNKSIASRTASMVSRTGGKGPYMMTGGVARNLGVVRELEKKLGEPIFVAENPDLCGALGAALIAMEEK